MSNDKKNTNRPVYEPASQRRHYRLTAPFFVILNHEKYKAVDWSVGGVRLKDINVELEVGDTQYMSLILNFHGFEFHTDVASRVVHKDDETQEVGFEYDLDARQEQIFEYFIQGIISGEMQAFEDIIRHVDTPVTAASLEPHISKEKTKERPKKSKRPLIVASLYLVIGLVLSLYLALTLYAFFTQVKIERANIYVPTVDIVNIENAKVGAYLVKVGDKVTVGQSVVEVKLPELQQNIEMAKIAIKEAENTKGRIQFIVDAGETKLDVYSGIGSNRYLAQQYQVERLKKQLDFTDREVKRLQNLQNKDYTSEQELEDSQKKSSNLKHAISIAERERNIQKEAYKAIPLVGYFTGDRFDGDLSIFRAELIEAKNRIQLEKKKLAVYEREAKALSLKSPVDGVVSHIASTSGANVTRGTVLLLIQETSKKVVHAYVPVSDLKNIYLNKQIIVYIPFTNEYIKASIEKIVQNPRYMQLYDEQSQFLNRTNEYALVILKLKTEKKQLSKLGAGTPVVVIFKESLLTKIWRALKQPVEA